MMLGEIPVLSWSRAIHVRFALDRSLESFMRGHVEAFSAFQGCPRTILHDNLESVVPERAARLLTCGNRASGGPAAGSTRPRRRHPSK